MIDAPEGNPLFPDADRITRVGGVLRRLSLDELPQLWNVARGEMSIVGPRPTLPYQVERYDDRQRRRLAVRPGLTGLAQVNGRNSIAWAERIELDLEYVGANSVGRDLVLVIRTVPALLSGRRGRGPPHRRSPRPSRRPRALSVRILLVITSTDRRGPQVFATHLADALGERGHVVRTVALVPGTGERLLPVARARHPPAGPATCGGAPAGVAAP